MKLTESQLSTITNALRVAAEKYDANAKVLRQEWQKRGGKLATMTSLASQFDLQADDARKMAQLIDEAESIEVQQ